MVFGGGIANTVSNAFFENTVWKNGSWVLFKSLRASKTLTRSLLRLRCCLLVANNPSLRPRYVASLDLQIAFLNDAHFSLGCAHFLSPFALSDVYLHVHALDAKSFRSAQPLPTRALPYSQIQGLLFSCIINSSS